MRGAKAGVDPELVEILSSALSISRERAERLLESKATRVLRYKSVRYITIRRDISGHYEGTVILISTRTGSYRKVEGYPHIKRVLLLGRAVPRHFVDDIVVEEKMDGHNVRVVRFEGEIYAITRGGYICPYTTSRMRRKYGKGFERLFDSLGDDIVVGGEVVGLENPYTRYHYPEAPDWDYFVFDMYRDPLDFLPVDERRSAADDSGLRNVRELGRFPKEEWARIREIIEGLERLGREGVVIKDPYYRVEPLKYTTSFINVHDIEQGMRFPFDEGHTFIFPRVLREMFKAIEEEWDEERLRAGARRIGEAIFLPAVESIRNYLRGEPIAERFVLSFASREEMDEYISYAASLGVPVSVIRIEESPDGGLRAVFLKHKKTEDHYRRIFATGLSPLD